MVEQTVRSILSQSLPPTQVTLFLPKSFDRFGFARFGPNVPNDNRIEIVWVDRDLGPVTKIAYARNYYSDLDDDDRLVVCDDDQIYPENWLSAMLNESEQVGDDPVVMSGLNFGFPGSKLPRAKFKGASYRLRRFFSPALIESGGPWSRSGYVDIAEGWAGIMIKKGLIPLHLEQIPNFAKYVDDIWISACLARDGLYPWLASPGLSWSLDQNPSCENALKVLSWNHRNRAELNQFAITHLSQMFQIWENKKDDHQEELEQ
jgi:hypothetical protein